MTDDFGWTTDRVPEGEPRQVWAWDKTKGKAVVVFSDLLAGRPWQPIPPPFEPPPYVEPKPVAREWLLSLLPKFNVADNWGEATVFPYSGKTPKNEIHIREVLPTDIDQDMVSEVRGCMSIVLNDEKAVTNCKLINFIATCMNKLTPPDQT